MGTIVTIDLFCGLDIDSEAVREGLERARATLQRADNVFSTWRAGSPVSRLRRGELMIKEAPRDVATVLEGCRLARALSRGWFDPWAMPGGVDPTGYVKGWAAERALGWLHLDGVTGAMVNAAGDITSFGGPAAGCAFKVGIVNPAIRNELACTVQLAGAIATSGNYERDAHLIDPWTQMPTARAASASVTGPDLGLADALATALAVAGEDWLDFIEPIDGYEGFVIGYDGSWCSTSQFPVDKRWAV